MAKIIKEADFIKENTFIKLAEDLAKLAEAGEKADTAIKTLATDMKEIKIPKLNVKEILETEKRLKAVNDLYERKNRIDKDNIKTQQEQEKLAGIRERNERARAKEAERVAKQQEIANKRRERQEKELNSAYQQTQKRASELYQKLRDLAIVGDTNSKAYRNLKKEYDQLDSSLKKVDATFGKHQRNVGNYPNAINGITGALGKLGIAFSGVALARNAFNVMAEFDEKVADVQKTTGLTKNEVEDLSMELGKLDTRTSVTALQELASAGGRLNLKTKKEITDFVESADKAFVALGDDLGGTAEEIATNLGKIASTFGDEGRYGIGEAITRTGSALNELSANSKASAGAILDFTNRMAGVASLSGIAQTDIQALGALFDSTGQSIEVASTTLNTLLPKLSSDYERFAKIAGMSADEFKKLAGKDAIEALKRVAIGAQSSEEGLNGLNETLKSFGIESARGASIVGTFSGNIDEFNRLQKISNDAFTENISLQNEFNTKNATLSAGIEKLKKEWDLWVISLQNSTGSTNKLVWVFNTLAKNLPAVLSLIGKLVGLWVTWKAVIKAQEIAKYVKGIGGLSGAFGELTGKVKGATIESQNFGRAMKAIGWTALISVVAQVALKFYDIASGADEARRRSNDFYKAQKKGAKDVSEFLKSLQTNRDEESSTLLASGGDINKGVAEINKKYDSLIKAEIKALNKRKDEVKLALLNFNEANEKELAKNPMFRNQFVNIKERTFKAEIYEINEELKALISELGGVEAPYDKLIEENDKLAESTSNSKEKLGDWTKELRNLRTSELTELKKSLGELENAYNDNLEKIKDTDIKAKEYRIELERKFNSDRLKLINEYEAEQDRLRREARKEDQAYGLDFELGAIDTGAQVTNLDRLQEYYNKRQEIIDKYADNQEKMSEELSLLEDETNRKSLELTIDTAQKKIEAIRTIYADLLGSDNDLLSEADLKAKKEFENQINTYQTEILQADIELQNQRLNNNNKTTDILKDVWKKTADFIVELLKGVQDYMNKIYDAQVNAQNRIIEKSIQQKNSIMAMYAVGNQEATQSIEAETKRQEEALRRIEAIEKRRMRMQLFTSILGAAGSALGGAGNGANAQTTINSFINSLPKFEKGTDLFRTNGSGLDGRGGELAVLHDKEKVFTSEHSAMIGYTTPNKVVAETMYKVRTGQLSEGSSFDAMEVIRPLAQEIKEGFKNITSVNTNVESIVDGVLTLTTTKTQGRVKISNRNKYKA